MPSLRPPMQKNFSPAPVITSTRVRVSRRIASMQSRISWHIAGVNMLPSSGRFSVSQPIGPSSSYRMVVKAKGASLCVVGVAELPELLPVEADPFLEHLSGVLAEPRRRQARHVRTPVDLESGPDHGDDAALGPEVIEKPAAAQLRVGDDLVDAVDRPSRDAGGAEGLEPVVAWLCPEDHLD